MPSPENEVRAFDVMQSIAASDVLLKPRPDNSGNQRSLVSKGKMPSPFVHRSMNVAAHRNNSVLLLFALLSAPPGMAASEGWTYEASHGFATHAGLPGGQLALVHDGIGQQARTISYTANDNTDSIDIERAYGPRGRKAIETENGALRHHIYGNALSPLMRVESDGDITYQVGLQTLSVPASGAATAAHRVVDFKESTIAVLDNGMAQQRASYAAFGAMRMAQNNRNVYTDAVLLAGYEGLTAWLLGSDQLADNRARVYDAASGRFLALDGAGQARAYEARSNDPVTRADTDGNVDFARLVRAVQADPTIPIVFGDRHTEPFGILALISVALKLMNTGTRFRIYQESLLLSTIQSGVETVRDFHQDQPYTMALEYFIRQGWVDRLQPERNLAPVSESETNRINAVYGQGKNYPVMEPAFVHWETNIPVILARMRAERTVALFFVGSAHIFPLSNQAVKITIDDTFRSIVMPYSPDPNTRTFLLISMSSFDLQSKWNMVSVMPYATSQEFAKYSNSHYFFEQTFESSFDYSVRIPFKVFARHRALAEQYSGSYPFPLYFLPRKNLEPGTGESDEKKDEDDEKNGDAPMSRRHAASQRPMSKPESGDSFKKKYFKE